MHNLYLIIVIGGQRALLPAACVESVVEVTEITSVPCAPPHVRGLFALRSRVLTVIDPLPALGERRASDHGDQAVIVHVDGHLYAMLVDDVDDVVVIDGAPAAPRALLSPGWASHTEGALELDGEPLLLIDVATIIAGPLDLAA
ncbi:MAG: chemotaxis protein CheW [Pseudomonadota bacterium]